MMFPSAGRVDAEAVAPRGVAGWQVASMREIALAVRRVVAWSHVCDFDRGLSRRCVDGGSGEPSSLR